MGESRGPRNLAQALIRKDESLSDIAELETRISAALDRIGNGIEGLSGGDSLLAEQLEEERTANAQLEERVKAIKQARDEAVAALESQLSALQAEMAALQDAAGAKDAQLQQLASVNAELRASNASLREANAAGLADASLVDAAMASELAALNALRAGDRAELDEVLARLGAIVGEAANA